MMMNLIRIKHDAYGRSPVAYITKPTTELGTKPAPFMAAFSSVGPNTITPEILKVFPNATLKFSFEAKVLVALLCYTSYLRLFSFFFSSRISLLQE